MKDANLQLNHLASVLRLARRSVPKKERELEYLCDQMERALWDAYSIHQQRKYARVSTEIMDKHYYEAMRRARDILTLLGGCAPPPQKICTPIILAIYEILCEIGFASP